MEHEYKLGIDIGSTTIKLIVLNSENKLVFSDYKRHFSNIRETLLNLVHTAKSMLGDIFFQPKITGSGGLSLANWVGVPFVQEVIAVAKAVSVFTPSTDVAIEIGGEDAKIIYFGNSLEQRMNGICAGGTGSFIDQMAALLQTDAAGLNDSAKKYATIYPIAARCGVFAKTDIQPLINEGAAIPDLAASIFQAVVSQTISGLACGKPIHGRVAFLGGPLHFLTELKNRFIDVLRLNNDEVISHENSHLFAAMGSALTDTISDRITFDSLIGNLCGDKKIEHEINRLDPLFSSAAEYENFTVRHSNAVVKRAELSEYKGKIFLGIDAGSTTTKLALIGESGELLHSFYAANQGSPLTVIKNALCEIYELIPSDSEIAYSCTTGYGEALTQAALLADMGEIETMAHYRAAAFFEPEVDFILDIGGQDMKCIRIADGAIDSVLLNEACSAGCGSFIETFAKSLDFSIPDFAKIALYAKKPIDLGSRCTVFMNSRVKQAQKEGAEVADISAGLAYSVIKNALLKVIKITDPSQLGKKIVVQGGTFYNDAVLRGFELIAQREAIRPDIAGMMGAFGAALTAKDVYHNKNQNAVASQSFDIKTTLLDKMSIENQNVQSSMTRCKGCGNNCLLTVNRFDSGDQINPRSFISGNRCEKMTGKPVKSGIINLFEYKYKRVFDYEPLREKDAKRGVVGIPRVLNMYENYPLWFTFFTELGYHVKLSPPSTRKIYELGMESMPSESVCYPAKMAHGHIMSLLGDGVKYIFYPSVAYEKKEDDGADNHYNCPIVTSYPENIKNNIEELKSQDIQFVNPFINLNDKNLAKRLSNELNLSLSEVKTALVKAIAEQKHFKDDIKVQGEKALDEIKKNNQRAIVLAGRPYHIDPAINHGIPELINGYGVCVLTEDSVAHLAQTERPLSVMDQWAYHSRLYAAAQLCRTEPNLQLVQLNSFGCGLDAVTTDEAADILRRDGKIYTCLKIDEISNLGSVRIRIRSLLAALDERVRKRGTIHFRHEGIKPHRIFTKAMRGTHTIIVPQMAPFQIDLLKEACIAAGYNVATLPAIDKKAIDTGLKYVNNDACYPALIVVGQVLDALQSGEYDLEHTAVLMTQTGGGCRASNYIHFIRKALIKAGFENIPVVSLNASGLEKDSGFTFSLKLADRALQALCYGDLFMRVLYRVRPYELIEGSANALYERWNEVCKQSLRTGKDFKKNIYGVVCDFDKLPIKDIHKPKVGVVGEILVKFHPTANNDLVALLEKEGAEAVCPDLTDFLMYSLYNSTYKVKYFGFPKSKKIKSDLGIGLIDFYRRHMRAALKQSQRFTPPADIRELGKMAEPIVSLGNQTGEGWFLTAEMVELIHSGVNNIVCTQPFGCLPNHVTGKGIIKALKDKFPLSNVVAIDYDPGASEVNQLNRIKLMLTTAFENMNKESAVKA